MKQIRLIMGMPVTIEIVDAAATDAIFKKAFDYFKYVDEKFSTFKPGSEIMKINRGELEEKDWSADMKTIFSLAAKANRASEGYFDIKKPDGSYDPSGLVKGWAIQNA